MNRRAVAVSVVIYAGAFGAASASAQDTARSASSAVSTTAAPADYLIGPEDVLDILVWKNTDLSRTVPVRPDGKLSIPLVNDIQAAGLTTSALRDLLVTRLGEYVPSPEISVIVREVHSIKVSVVGAVKTPGRFELKSPATVLELIAMAQGLTDFASRDKIVVLRQNNGRQEKIPFNYGKVASGDEQENFFVRTGDIVFVP